MLSVCLSVCLAWILSVFSWLVNPLYVTFNTLIIQDKFYID